MRACSVCRVCRTAPQRVGRGFVFNIRCRDGDTVHHVEHIPRSQPASQSEKSISGDRSLLDISSHRGNVHSDRALLAPLSESVGRMDRFRRNLGACRSRNHSQFDRPCNVQALLDDMLSRNGVDDRALREADIPCNRSMGMRISHRRRSILHRRLRALPSREEEPQKIHTFGIPSVRRFRKHNAHVHDSFLHSIKRHEI